MDEVIKWRTFRESFSGIFGRRQPRIVSVLITGCCDAFIPDPRSRIIPAAASPDRKRTMILTGSEIQQRLGKEIVIEPFDEKLLNPNSYNLRLHDELLVYEEIVLDLKRPNRYRRYVIPPEGLVLQPNQLYLGRTVERTETHNLVPMLEGRSSI